MPRSLVPAAWLAALTLALSAHAIEPPKPAEKWAVLEADGFRLISAVSPGETKRIARDLLQLRAALGKVSDFRLQTAEPARVFVFPTPARFAVYCKTTRRSQCENIHGLFLGTGTSNFILLRGNTKTVDRAVYHELTHYLMANTNARLPLWFHEGLAEYYSTFRTVGDATHLGTPIDDHVRFLADEKRLIPLRELFAVTASSPIYNEGARTGVFYAQSWTLVHYLLHDTGRREKLHRFLALLGSGKPVDDAFEGSFGMPFSKLEQELRAYIRGASFTIYSYKFDDLTVPELAEPAAMPHHAVLHQFGRLLAHTRPENAATAERFLKDSLAANAKNAGAHAELGRLYDTTGRRKEADAAFAEALDLAGDDLEVHLIAGRSILGRDISEFGKARPLFKRATELAPESAAAWAGLGTTYIIETTGHAPGIAALEKSLDLDPYNEETAFYLTQLLTHDGRRYRDVRKLAEALLARTTNEWMKEPLTTMLAMARVNEAVDMANAGKWTEALALVDAALPAIRDERARKETLAVREMITAEVKKRE